MSDASHNARYVVRVYVDGEHAVTVFADQPRTLERWLPADGKAHAVAFVIAPLGQGDDPVVSER